MQFLRIEKALNRLVSNSTTEGRFYQTAGEFENILSNNDLSATEKAEQIADILERGLSSK